MDNNLKLSYDMIFENSLSWDEDQPESDSNNEPQTISIEEMQQQLQEKDNQWQNKLEKEREIARKAGLEQGFAEGKEQAKRQYLKRVSEFEEMINQIDLKYNQIIDDLKPHIVKFVFDITEKILDIPFKHEGLREQVHQEVAQIIENLDDELHLKVTLSEADFDTIQKAFEQNKEMNHITLKVDENLNNGEYTVETKKECIIKNFKGMIDDFKESVSFADNEPLELKP